MLSFRCPTRGAGGLSSLQPVGALPPAASVHLSEPRQVERRPQASRSSSIQHRISGGSQQIGARREAFDRFVEGNGPAAGRAAFLLAFWTGVEIAQPAEIPVGSRLDQKDFDLMIGDAWTLAAPKGFEQRNISGPAERAEPFLRRDPYGQIDVLAFVPNLDSGATEIVESRDFLPQRFGRRADHRDRLDFLESHQRVGNDIRGPAEIALPPQHETILILDLGAFQGWFETLAFAPRLGGS